MDVGVKVPPVDVHLDLVRLVPDYWPVEADSDAELLTHQLTSNIQPARCLKGPSDTSHHVAVHRSKRPGPGSG
jgi:hypothetical protein